MEYIILGAVTLPCAHTSMSDNGTSTPPERDIARRHAQIASKFVCIHDSARTRWIPGESLRPPRRQSTVASTTAHPGMHVRCDIVVVFQPHICHRSPHPQTHPMPNVASTVRRVQRHTRHTQTVFITMQPPRNVFLACTPLHSWWTVRRQMWCGSQSMTTSATTTAGDDVT